MIGRLSVDRFHGVDVVRGLAIILMALDHIKDYWAPTLYDALDIANTSPSWFITRWITHFCAPTFIFLAGMSTYFQLAKQGNKAALSRHLLTRGLWLILLEVVIVNMSWKAGLPLDYLWLQVIWVIGLSMIFCAAAIWLPTLPLALLALAIVAGHDLLNTIEFAGESPWWWIILHQRGEFELLNSGYGIFISYPLLPWPGVMLLGYLLGQLYINYPQYSLRWTVWLGCMALGLFFILRIGSQYGDPSPYIAQENVVLSLMAFLNVSKYPASLHFICVTLGLCLLLVAFAQRFRFWGAAILSTFGKVPMFFYLLHIPLIHLSSQIWLLSQYGETVNLLTADPDDWPISYEPSIVRVYVVWVVFLFAMYFLCKAYWNLKSTRRDIKLLSWI